VREGFGDDRRQLALELCQLRPERAPGSALTGSIAIIEDALACLVAADRGVGIDDCLLGVGHASPSRYA
jgi:hypothetical protein